MVQACTHCRELGRVDLDWRCSYCAWWSDLANNFQRLFDAMKREDGDEALFQWSRSFSTLHGVFGAEWRRSGLKARHPHPAVLTEHDARAARLCWQVTYGMWHFRLDQINQTRVGEALKPLRPTSFTAQAAAAARVARKRVEAKKKAVQDARPKLEVRSFRLPVSLPIALFEGDVLPRSGTPPEAMLRMLYR